MVGIIPGQIRSIGWGGVDLEHLTIHALVRIVPAAPLQYGHPALSPVRLIRASNTSVPSDTAVNVASGAIWALVPAQLSHIVDYDTWKNGGERSATYYSLYNLVLKSSGALGGAFGLALAGWFGFDATSTSQSDSGVLGLHAALAYGPFLFFLLAMVFVYLNPINETRHRSIRKWLDRQEARAGVFELDVKQNALGA